MYTERFFTCKYATNVPYGPKLIGGYAPCAHIVLCAAILCSHLAIYASFAVEYATTRTAYAPKFTIYDLKLKIYATNPKIYAPI